MLHTKDMNHKAHNMFISYTNHNHKLSLGEITCYNLKEMLL